MTKSELICEILELNVTFGITNEDEFVNYMTKVLPRMTTFELYAELEHTETNTLELQNG